MGDILGGLTDAVGGIVGGLTGSLFGETVPSSVTNQPALTPGQQELLNALTGHLTDNLASLTSGPTQGSVTNALTGQADNFMNWLTQLQGGATGGQQASGTALNQLLSAIPGLNLGQIGNTTGAALGGSQQTLNRLLQNLRGYNPDTMWQAGSDFLTNVIDTPYDAVGAQSYFSDAVLNPAMRNWEERIIPTIQEKYASMNASDSGALNRAIAKSGSDLNADLSAQLADLIFKDKSQYENRQDQAGQLAAGMGQTGMSNLSDINQALTALGLSSAGTQQSGLGTLGNLFGTISGAAVDQASAANQVLATLLGLGELESGGLTNQSNYLMQLLNSALGTNGINTVVTQGTTSPGLLSGMAGGFGTALGNWAFSDERLKKNIRPLATINGIQLVGFEWDRKNYPEFPEGCQTGVIAQDLLESHPEMVTTLPLQGRDWLAVDYGQVAAHIARG